MDDGPPSSPPTDPSFEESTDCLTLLAFNAGLLEYSLFGYRILRNAPYAWRRLAQFPTALGATRADIIALQEVYLEHHADFLVEALRLRYPYAARRTSGGLLALHNGLLTLSRYPIVSTWFHRFNNITWSEGILGSKGVLGSVVLVPGVGKTCVLNVHLASGTVDPESRTLNRLRAEEAQEILKLADEATNRGEVPVVLGDFNSSPGICPASYRTMIVAGWTDAFLEGQLAFEPNFGKQPASSWVTGNPMLCSKPQLPPPPDLFGDTTRASFEIEMERTCVGLPSGAEDMSSAPTSCILPVREPTIPSVGPDTLGAEEDQEEPDDLWTWDPRNSLNQLGPHASCHGLRCDHLFWPPLAQRRGFRDFCVTHSRLLFTKPRVLIQGERWRSLLRGDWWSASAAATGGELLVTLSDHYGVMFEVRRDPSLCVGRAGRPLADHQSLQITTPPPLPLPPTSPPCTRGC